MSPNQHKMPTEAHGPFHLKQRQLVASDNEDREAVGNDGWPRAGIFRCCRWSRSELSGNQIRPVRSVVVGHRARSSSGREALKDAIVVSCIHDR
jgi:hypothetical protein